MEQVRHGSATNPLTGRRMHAFAKRGARRPRSNTAIRWPAGDCEAIAERDIAELRTAEGKLYLFVAIDPTSKFAVAQLMEKADRKTAWEFLKLLLEAVPDRIHTILTDNRCPAGDLEKPKLPRGGIQFAEQPRNRNTINSRPMRFDMICEANVIEHRLTKPNHPWTNGPPLGDCRQSPAGERVERMNRTIKDATVKRYHYDRYDQLRGHLADFLDACNFARRLKTLSGLTPCEELVPEI